MGNRRRTWDPPKPVTLVEVVTHTSTCINGQNVVLRKREWVRSDDPRVLAPGGFKFDYGPTAETDQASEINEASEENSCGIAVHGSVEHNEETAAVGRASDGELSETPGRASIAQREDTVEDGCAAGLKFEEPKSTEVESDGASIAPTSVTQTIVAESVVAESRAQSLAASLLAKPSIPKREPQREAGMSSQKLNEEDCYEEDEVGADEQEEGDDRPWPITKRTVAAIDGMSPNELEDLIENVDDHERWQDLREDAKRRTSQWLSGIKKAEEAPRCQFVKLNGKGCGSPAMNGATLCYYHAQAQARSEAEEARKLEMPALEDRASIQLALVRVCNHLVGKSIDERTGRAIISALRLAQRNLGDQESLL